jgi:predicted amidohydrolase
MSTIPSGSSSPLVVAGVQMDVAIGQPAENCARMEGYLARAAREGANLIVFPECAVSGYCFESLAEARPHAEPIPGPSTERLARACREWGVCAVVGLLEAEGPRVFNACALIGPSGLIGSYRKIHLPYLGIDMFTTPGDRPFGVWQAASAAGQSVRVGMSICYDAAFPEASRVMALEGAEIICLPTNWPPGAECTADYVINARALENHVYFAAVNRIGVERGFSFIGRSKICDPAGRVLAQAGDSQEEVIYAQIDPALARRKHVIRVPGKHEIHRFADRRPEMYGAIVQPVREASPFPPRGG